MAMAHSRPKDDDKRRNRTPQVHDWVDVEDVPFDGPPLERLRPDMVWLPAAKAWWDAVRTMPHCALWNIGDWTFAAETALIVNEINSGNFSPTLLGHLTRRELAIGMTEAQRRSQRLRYVQAPSSGSKPRVASSSSDRRERLLKAVGED